MYGKVAKGAQLIMIHLAVRLNGSGLIGDIVNIFTKSKSSHVGLVFTDGTS